MASQNKAKMKQVGDLALLYGHIGRAVECLQKCDDLSGLLLIYSSLGMKDRLELLGERAEELTRANVAFAAYFLLHNLEKCIDVLVNSNRIEQAAIFARTYCPSHIPRLVDLWKESLKKEHPITA